MTDDKGVVVSREGALGITKAGGRALMGTLMNILLEEQDKMLRSFQAQLGENAEAGADAR